MAATLDENRQEVLDEALPKVVESRASIEQAKGALMLVYGISTEQTFNLVRWRSQQTNTKLRALAMQLVAEFHTLAASEPLRSEFDHLFLTVHQRIPPSTRHNEAAKDAIDDRKQVSLKTLLW